MNDAILGEMKDYREKVAAEGPPPERPVIQVIGGALPAVVDQAEEALLADADHPLYQRGGQLVAVLALEKAEEHGGIKREAGTPLVRAVQSPNLVERLTRAACFEKYSARERKWLAIDAPGAVASALLSRGEWRFPKLVSIAESPRLRPDGSVLAEPGFDPATGIFYAPSIDFPAVPEHPTREDAREACEELLEVVCDFPFEGRDEHRSAWVAATLTPFARAAFIGPPPLVAVDKNVHGAGGSLLADLIGIIATGRSMSRSTHPKEDEEMRKRITALALAGDELVLFDNCTGTIGGAALNAALTGTTWRDRILGMSEMTPEMPLVATFFVTSNNATFDRDTTRRSLPIRLDSPLEHPEERNDFRHPDVRLWTRQHRPRLVQAALTILRAFFAAGRPEANLKAWGSYEGWSGVVRQAVVFAGLPDPCATRSEFVSTADSERTSLLALFDGIEELDPHSIGLTAAEILRRLDRAPEDHRGLRESLLELCPQRDGRPFLPTARQLGMRLHFLRRRVVGDRMVDRQSRAGGVVAWRVTTSRPVGPAEPSWTSTASNPRDGCHLRGTQPTRSTSVPQVQLDPPAEDPGDGLPPL